MVATRLQVKDAISANQPWVADPIILKIAKPEEGQPFTLVASVQNIRDVKFSVSSHNCKLLMLRVRALFVDGVQGLMLLRITFQQRDSHLSH
jgi:hypothetical protein